VRGLFLLDPEVTHLNHGAFGACPRRVFERYQGWQRQLERNPADFLGRRADALLDEARTRLAEYVGARADDLVFVPNATFGLNLVARALSLVPGDEVLVTDHEYGAADLMWRVACRRSGARYVRCRLPRPLDDTAEVVEAVTRAITPRTRVLSFSHVTSATALVLPVKELCRRAREAGVLTVVDGAHAPGQVPVDLESIGADAYAGNCHKWLCAPKGAGFLHVRPEHQEWVESLVVGWGWADESAGFVRRNQAQGTRDPAAYLSVPDAIVFQDEHGWDAVRARCHELAWEARQRLAALSGREPLSSSAHQLGQMVSTPLPRVDAGALMRRLAEEQRIEILARDWNGEPVLRVSFQGYNTSDDLERLLAVLPDLLPARSSRPRLPADAPAGRYRSAP
jgi:isopenicillin-N epimerase